MKKNNPDDRRDNVENIQKNIDYTIANIRRADELIAKTSDDKLKSQLKAKNKRRRTALAGFRKEIKDEAQDRREDMEVWEDDYNELL